MTAPDPSDPPPDLTVVLVNWNALGVTADALESIRAHTRDITYEVYAVDNGSTKDASATELPARFPWVRFIANGANLGFTKANNQGIRPSRGRYVVLLNNDTVQTENALGAAVRYMDAHPDVGALGIMHRNNDAERSFQPSFFAFPTAYGAARGLLLGSRPLPAPVVEEKDVDWVCGSFLLMRREALEQVGELDERFFIYEEDVDWCLRAHRKGWKVRFWPGASMIHLGAAANPFMKDKTLVMFRSHVSYLRKHFSPVAAAAFYLAMGLRLALAVAKAGARAVTRRGPWADIRQRWGRFVSFAMLRPGRVGG